MSKVEARLKELGIALPEPSSPIANYVNYKVVDGFVYISGKGPVSPERTVTGKVGADLTLEQGYEAARLTGISLIAALKQAAGGDLDRVDQIVKLLGFVACADGFYDAPKVINGCSDLLVEVFGDGGRHARSAIPTHQLPLGIPVEIEMIARLKD
ncbi:MAG: RidA family protein [Clostridiales bacterium]|nr:RidA family protein [Clostridiales bacterium]